MNPEPVYDKIADAILDGAPVDWTLLETNEATGPRDRALVEQLRTLETLRSRLRTRAAEDVTVWGHLKVYERVGHGAYGDVYRAWDSRLDREVALKLLPHEPSSPDSPASTIIEEGRLMARVRHPNVVSVYGAERIDGRAGLWMELVKGRTLEQALRDGQKYSASGVAKLGATLSRAVAAVHAAGLLHRDIKAQNVMLDESGRLVLMDFGTGREREELEATAGGNVAGTPLYLAPEVLAGGAATPQSDVYSIGVVLFRLLTTDYPVSAPTLAELERQHSQGGIDVRINRAEIPARLRRVLARALDPDPARRYAGAAEFASALEATVRVPAYRRALFAVVVVVVTLLAGLASWNLGLRERLSPALIAVGIMKAPVVFVRPFTDAGSEPGHASFIDGLTSEVIGDLGTIDGLQVIQHETSSYFRNRPRDLGEIKKLLRADYVVEAGVQRLGTRVHIRASLVRLSDEKVVWSQPYDRQIDEVAAIQEEISREIVNQLRLTIGRGQRRYQTNTAAHDLYLRGRLLALEGGTKNAQAAIKIFEEVIRMDANFAPAHAGLAEAYSEWAWQLDGLTNDESLAAMRPAAQRALQLDPLLAEAHGAMGVTLAREFDWEGAKKAFEKALDYHPNLSAIRMRYVSTTLLPLGELAEAENQLLTALEIDPLSPSVFRDLGIVKYVGGRYAEAIANFEQAMEVDPGFFAVNQLRARALMFAGRPGEAIKIFESRPGYTWERWILPAYVKAGRTQDVERLRAENQNDAPHRQAILWAALGDKDRTIEALIQAAEDMPQRVAFFLVCPDFALVLGHPRLEVLKQRLNLR